jgi:LemA protein
MNWISWVIIIAVILILVIWFVASYNRLISGSVRVDNSWAQIDVQLKKRFDLIPNLVSTVKGYAAHEQAVLTDVTKYRSEAMSSKTPAEAMSSNAKLSTAITNLFATAEQYPALKADQHFLTLQNQLQNIEDKIAVSRQFYNDTAMKYNESVMHFPTNIVASIFHFERKQYFEIPEADKSVPEVKF